MNRAFRLHKGLTRIVWHSFVRWRPAFVWARNLLQHTTGCKGGVSWVLMSAQLLPRCLQGTFCFLGLKNLSYFITGGLKKSSEQSVIYWHDKNISVSRHFLLFNLVYLCSSQDFKQQVAAFLFFSFACSAPQKEHEWQLLQIQYIIIFVICSGVKILYLCCQNLSTSHDFHTVFCLCTSTSCSVFVCLIGLFKVFHTFSWTILFLWFVDVWINPFVSLVFHFSSQQISLLCF